MQCSNHLKQIGLATLNYTYTRQFLPPSRKPNEGPSWAWLILPQLERENLYKSWNFSQSAIFQIDAKILQTTVPVYFCPSRRAPNGGGAKPFAQDAA